MLKRDKFYIYQQDNKKLGLVKKLTNQDDEDIFCQSWRQTPKVARLPAGSVYEV